MVIRGRIEDRDEYPLQYAWYVELIGMVSLLTEATLGMPQLIRNCKRKSTQGMR